MTRHHCNVSSVATPLDIVHTPDLIARQIIQRYAPTGRILDPCRGDGAFWRQLPGASYCEIKEGKDFFEWKTPVDWIIGNPPYSIMNQWLSHSFALSTNVVYLIPVAKVFGSLKRLKLIAEFGGIVDIWAPWTGRSIGFEFGWAVGAVHMRRNFLGPINLSITKLPFE